MRAVTACSSHRPGRPVGFTAGVFRDAAGGLRSAALTRPQEGWQRPVPATSVDRRPRPQGKGGWVVIASPGRAAWPGAGWPLRTRPPRSARVGTVDLCEDHRMASHGTTEALSRVMGLPLGYSIELSRHPIICVSARGNGLGASLYLASDGGRTESPKSRAPRRVKPQGRRGSVGPPRGCAGPGRQRCAVPSQLEQPERSASGVRRRPLF